MRTLRTVGVPYTDDQIANAAADMKAQADPDNAGADAFGKRYAKAVVRTSAERLPTKSASTAARRPSTAPAVAATEVRPSAVNARVPRREAEAKENLAAPPQPNVPSPAPAIAPQPARRLRRCRDGPARRNLVQT